MFIAFDPGRSCGWAAWSSGYSAPRYGLIDLSSDTEGALYAKAGVRFSEYVGEGAVVAVEAPILPRGGSIKSRLVLFGIRAQILSVAHRRGARVIEPTVSEWRKHFIGVTQAPKDIKGTENRRRWIKGVAIRKVASLGWGAVGADEADAIGILDYLRFVADPDYAT
jgi:hypothetical protein